MEAKRIVAVATLAIGLGAMAVAIPAPGAAASAKSKVDKTAKGRKVCRSLVPTGSRFATRVCRTREEWAENQDKAQDGVLQYQRNNTTSSQNVSEGNSPQ